MDILYKSDKDLFELRLQLLKMNRDQIQALYNHMCESKDRKLWLIADSIHRRSAPGLQWGNEVTKWLTLDLEKKIRPRNLGLAIQRTDSRS